MTRSSTLFSLFLLVAPLATACTTIRSDMTINGQPFVARSCRTLANQELFGLELGDAQDRQLRFVRGADDRITVYVMSGGPTPVPTPMSGCATARLDRTPVGKSYELDGDVTVHCDTTDIHVHGNAQFHQCFSEWITPR